MLHPSGDNNDKSTATHSVSIEVPTVAIINSEASSISPSPEINSFEAGEAVDFETVTNSDLCLNYPSIVNEGNPGTISASTSGNSPSSVGLYVKASDYQGNGKEQTGKVVNVVEKKELTTNVIHDIKNCHTGNGVNNDHNITYSLKVKDQNSYRNINAGSYSATVTYTITGN